MFKHTVLLLLFTITGLFSAEKYTIKEHLGTIAQNGNFLLCANVSDVGVDCGVFSIENNKPVLLLSTYIKNENIINFTDVISALLKYLHNTYYISFHIWDGMVT